MDIDPPENGSNIFARQFSKSCAHTFAFSSPVGHGAHQIPMVSNEAFSRAAFDRINSPGYEALKKRLMLTQEVLKGYIVSPGEYAMLDEAVVTGIKYNEFIKAYLGLGPLPGAETSGSMIRSAISATLAWTVGNYDESEAFIAQQLRKAGRLPDIDVLNVVTRDEWMARFPTSVSALVSLATQWISEKLEVQSNAYAHRNSDEQFRSAEPIFRGRVENTFRNMFTSRLRKMKEEVNKAEVELYPG